MNFFGLIYFTCLVSVTKSSIWGGGGGLNAKKMIDKQKNIIGIFIQAFDIELNKNHRAIKYNPLKEIAKYEIGAYALTEPMKEIERFLNVCATKLREFDQKLGNIDSHEVVFTSFYYKMLLWEKHNLSSLPDDNLVVIGAVKRILSNREISEDIKTAFDEKIYRIMVPEELASFGKKTDFAIQLIYDIETKKDEVLKSPEFKSLDGKDSFLKIVQGHDVQCKELEVYEKFLTNYLIFHGNEFGNNGDINDYPQVLHLFESSPRALNLLGFVDMTLKYANGDNKLDEINYNSIKLDAYKRGSVGHFKHAALLFMRAVEIRVFNFIDLHKNRYYMFQKAFIENFSTRDKPFRLRVCSLNSQVWKVVYVLKEVYSANREKLNDPRIRLIFRRLLEWLSKYSQFRACLYTSEQIENTLSMIHEITPVEENVVDIVVPRGIATLEQLVGFASIERNSDPTRITAEKDFVASEPKWWKPLSWIHSLKSCFKGIVNSIG